MRRSFLSYIISVIVLSFIFVIFSLQNSSVATTIVSFVYILASSVSHAAVIMLLPYILLYVPMVLLAPRCQFPHYIFAVVAALIHVLACADASVFAIYKFHINGFVLSLLFGKNASQVFAFSPIIVAKSVCFVLVVIAINFLLVKFASFCYKRIKVSYVLPIVAIVFCALYANASHIYGVAVNNRQIVKSTELLPYYYPLRANRFMQRLGIIDAADTQQIRVDEGNLNYPLHEMQWDSLTTTPPNIVFIMIDAWNKRTFNQDVTPNISHFADSCVVYANHLSGSNGTQGGIFSLFTGMSSYYWTDFSLSKVDPVFVKRLLELDYDFQVFPSATICNPAFNKVLFHSVPNLRTDTEGETVYDRDCKLTSNFVNYIDTFSCEKPFFAWLFYDLAHSYQMPKEKLWKFQPSWEFADYPSLNANTDPTPFFNLYKNCLSQIDSLANIAIETLKEKSLLDNTIVVVTADHGQEFNDNGKNFWGHNGNFSQAQIGVPLMIYYKGIDHNIVKYRTSHYDVAATLLKSHLGLKSACEDFCFGHLLTDSVSRDWLVSGSRDNFAFVRENQILEKRPSGSLELTDSHLNNLPDSLVDFVGLNAALKQISRFYKE